MIQTTTFWRRVYTYSTEEFSISMPRDARVINLIQRETPYRVYDGDDALEIGVVVAYSSESLRVPLDSHQFAIVNDGVMFENDGFAYVGTAAFGSITIHLWAKIMPWHNYSTPTQTPQITVSSDRVVYRGVNLPTQVKSRVTQNQNS